MKPIVFILIHGTSNTDNSYADEFIRHCRWNLSSSITPNRPHFYPIFWGRNIYKSYPRFNIKRYVCRFLGDMSSYLTDVSYRRYVFDIIGSTVNEVKNTLDDFYLVFVAHSFGSKVAMDYLQDNSFLFPDIVFILSHPFVLPVGNNIDNARLWVNIFSRYDGLATQSICEFDNIDIEFSKMALVNPFCHTWYWNSKKVASTICDIIIDVMYGSDILPAASCGVLECDVNKGSFDEQNWAKY